MFCVVRFRCGLDVHEGDSSANSTDGACGRRRARALRPTQQLDILDSAIAANNVNVISNEEYNMNDNGLAVFNFLTIKKF